MPGQFSVKINRLVMTRLTPIDPTITFKGLELELWDARAMYDVLYSLIDRHFGCAAEDGKYVLTEAEGLRLFYAAGMANSLAMKVEESFHVASENDRKAHAKGGDA